MAGKSLEELGLSSEDLPAQSFDDLPEFGGFTPPPQPGPYRFQLPGDLSKVFERFEATGKGQRIRAVFDREAPLLIVQSPGGRANNDTYQARVSNQERKRGKDGPEASDMDYLLKALGEKGRPAGGNVGYAQTLITHAGKEFGSDVTYSWVCNPNRNIRVQGPDGKLVEVEGQPGCGSKYYQKDVAKDGEGHYPHELVCKCGAVLRVFSNLDNFRA